MLRANLNDIQVFMAVVDAGSFIAGSHAMGLSRSAAGKAITRLEERLGTRLLNRTTRALSLTDEGREFYQRGLQILASVDDAEASVAGTKSTARGVLRLTVPAAFGRLLLLPLLAKYLAAWPDVQVEMSFSDRLADLVDEGFDLAVRMGVTAPDTRLVSRVVAKYQTVLCASPTYLAKHGEPRDVDALAGHDCLLFSSRNQKQSWRLRDDQGIWVKAMGRSRLRLDNGEAIRDAALSGLGIAYLPDFLVNEELATGRLKQVLTGVEGEEVRIVTLYPNKRLLEPRVRRFIDLMVEELGS
ncbi:HTH-type transcriptional regulator DmlR [Serratia grimesii]|uniref:LysR family transcriptional regulator n=1 Tax=Serratia grimesii TaxID=82995 RepID=UPI00076F3D49|nr:LysR family transcriptional regulator [Serratia grimesii]CAI1141924.1 D-malate degradation protein R [Serratia grimesii]CUW13145.1 HTH-type transcriptional regulator DmlR [Serratia grimesii]SMZ56328.1 HTH-type transcriptional regulator DmlR [Serratia grimesii]